MRLWIAPLALAAMAPSPGARAAGDAERYSIRAEIGAEYDSNARRTENFAGQAPAARIGSALGRGVLTATLADAPAERHDVALSATAAGKVFLDPGARAEDVAVAQSGLTWRWAATDRLLLSALGAYYEAFQRGVPAAGDTSEQRDFRSLGSTLRLGVAVTDQVELAAIAGYRFFVFKPQRDFDFQGPTAGLELRWTSEPAGEGADWDVQLGAGYERRAFAGVALVNPCAPPSSVGPGCPPMYGTDRHLDQPLTARLEVVRTGRVLAGLGYALQYVTSNSFDSTVMRNFLTARFAAALPRDLFFVARAELLFAHYPEPLVLATTTLEGENHSSVRAELSWAVDDWIQLVARYTYYGPALAGSSVSYLRQTAMLGVAFTLEKS